VGVYGYCVVPAGQPDTALRGIDGAPVRIHTVGELAVLVSDIARPEPNAERIQQHNAVIEGVVTEELTPVPLRFGQWADQAAVFDAVVIEKAEWYRERLAAFAGAMEFGLRVLEPNKPASAQVVRLPEPASGLEYMNALRAKLAGARADRDALERVRAGISELMSGLVREERVEEARTAHGVVTVLHLVPRNCFGLYRNRAQSLKSLFPEFSFLVSGPWVPYSFAA
jgi:hypothetical protein